MDCRADRGPAAWSRFGSASFEMIRHLTDRLPVMTTPKWVHNKIQPIAIRDVLHYLVAAATAEVPESRAWDIGGPDVLEYGDMMQIYAEVAGLHRARDGGAAGFSHRRSPLVGRTGDPDTVGLARPLVESLHCDAVMDNHDIDTIIPPPPGGLTGYRDAVSLALSRLPDGEVETSRRITGTAIAACPAIRTGPARSSTPSSAPGGRRPPSKNSGSDRKHARTADWQVEDREPGSAAATAQERQPRRRVAADAGRHRVRAGQHATNSE